MIDRKMMLCGVAREALRHAGGDAATAASLLNRNGMLTLTGRRFTPRRVRVLADQISTRAVRTRRVKSID
jgi:hypothetical protein